MKFFHLADLHLGKSIHGYSMIEMGDQPFWIEQLLKKAEEIRPDTILISGDVYDRAVPSKEAVNLFNDFLTKLTEMKIPVLMIAGNHDSGSRLAFGDRIFRNQGIYIAGDVKKEILRVTLQDCYGPVNFWLVPYLFPAAVNMIFGVDHIRDYDSAMGMLLENQQINTEERNVILSHQFVIAGGERPSMGGSETTVGGIGQMDASVFDDFDYVALGHVHNTQKMGNEKVRYAGSPLCYHFSESGQKKGLTVVEIREKGTLEVSIEELPVLHKMKEISGTMEELLKAEAEENSYIRAVIRQELLPPQAVERLRTHFEAQNAILMEVIRDFSHQKRSGEKERKKDARTSSLEELFADFYSYQHDGSMPGEHLEKLIGFVAEQTRNCRGDESARENEQAIRQLIEFAEECKYEEEQQ